MAPALCLPLRPLGGCRPCPSRQHTLIRHSTQTQPLQHCTLICRNLLNPLFIGCVPAASLHRQLVHLLITKDLDMKARNDARPSNSGTKIGREGCLRTGAKGTNPSTKTPIKKNRSFLETDISCCLSHAQQIDSRLAINADV